MTPLLRCDRGAIMVMALFMAIFATGCLYYLSGIAEAIAQRERMQDAADAAAFSAAVLHARGMNVIALINMTMAALLAVLITLRLVEAVCIVGVTIGSALAFFTAGASLIPVAPLTTTGLLVREAYEVAEPIVHTTLRALRIAARGVRIAVPWVAQAQTVGTIAKRYRPYASFAFEVPGSLTLPTRDGTYDGLCTKAGEYVSDLAIYPFKDIPGVEHIGVGDLIEQLIGGGSGYFCGVEGAAAPSIARLNKIWHPKLPKGEACEERGRRAQIDRESSSAQGRAAEHQRLCDEGEREAIAADAAIDRVTGECTRDCGTGGLYEERATRALEACAPRDSNDGSLSRFWWQERRFKRRYLWEDEHWIVDAMVVPGSEYLRSVENGGRPCGTLLSTVGESWNVEQGRDGELVPICDNIKPPIGAPLYGGDTLEIEHTEVLRVFKCREVQRERQTVDGGAGALGAESKNDNEEMAPQLIAKDARLGEEPFQIRAVVGGTLPSTSPEVMLSALHSAEAEGNGKAMAVWEVSEQLGRVSVAQAELYFNEAGAEREDYLWAMSWSARLRPFRMPASEPKRPDGDDLAGALVSGVGEVFGTFEDACELARQLKEDIPCSAIDLDDFAELIAH